MSGREQDYYRHQEQRVIDNRVEEYKTFMYGTDLPLAEDDHPSLAEPHRMAKQHPFDCGIPGCIHCHEDKAFKKRRYRLTDAELDSLLDEYDITI